MARVLVVDDEAGIRSFVAECLELDRHHVEQAADGGAALQALRERSFELVISDLRMPVLDGMTLLETALTEQPELQFIMLTAHGNVETAVAAMRAGAFDYLQKPVSSPAELRLLAGRAIERRALLDHKERTELGPGLGDTPQLCYEDQAMAVVVQQLEKVARTNATVLLVGESGTGKEVAARAVHRLSARADGPFVAVNCATLSDNLLESELFGHEKGAFTGATARKRGRIEFAHGGTFFLDEVAELKPGLQAKLLRVLQERTFERVGGTRPIEVDVRWIAATNRDLRARIEQSEFREDLYHRLAVFPVQLPALRDRPKDILPLATALLARIGRELGRGGLVLDGGARMALSRGHWSGNIRELANCLERAAILSDDEVICAHHLLVHAPTAVLAPTASAAPVTLEDAECDAIRRALEQVAGNRRKAAELLGIGLRTLYDKLKRYGLD